MKKTFAFSPSDSIQRAYNSLLQKYKHSEGMVDSIKIYLLFGSALVMIGMYLYYVNLASTRGYFLRQERLKQENITFQYEILKTKILAHQQQNRDKVTMYVPEKNAIVRIKTQVVLIPSMKQLSLKK